ncbi:sigma 54-interacting transcriptional regulator [Clostridium sp. MSJ-11]|uniref:Sigma 54-interacting transcriptional regulator n=1 Tax=Clostridium mobile TaxID=2841512 RepID=A0ABS6EKZ2_9CLOT|nr:sigma 54-interacting transcriptional regulator [Clostridium mobile]MBU5485881.1 sigma 54-interacting transcriptional regulator [Clostridium mobile]
MIKITFVIPYSEIQNEVYNSLMESKEEGVSFKTIHIIGTQDLLLKEIDSDIIIARGLTYLALKNALVDIPVIEIEVTGYDVIRAINECKNKYNPKKIAVVGSETMIFGAESLGEIMNLHIEVFKIDNEEDVLKTLQTAKEHDIDAIVGGLTTYNMAESQGWKCVWIRTGKEAIRQAIKEAINAGSVVKHERAKNQLFKIILDNAKEGIVAVDKFGRIKEINKSAYKNLQISHNRNIKGEFLKKFLPKSRLVKSVEIGEEESDIIDNINETMIVSSLAPIRVMGNNEGAVITMQNVDKIQETESKIRMGLSDKGLRAKYSFGNIVGESKELNSIIQMAYKYSQVESNILLIGETGTGKELFAQSIHNASNRKFQPFVAVNCAALPENLLESELFGYVEGAFSGASKGGKIGLFELAHNGSIFLDEVGEISLTLQAKLLRVLQEREIRRIGDNKVIPIDVRVISATNIDIKEKVKKGEFRQDLLYRLDVLNLRILPLRERKEDIKHIVYHFIEQYCKKINKSTAMIKPEGLSILSSYSWPGNIRELRNICERLVVLMEGEYITEKDVLEQLNLKEEVEIFEGEVEECKEEYKNEDIICTSIEDIEMDAIKKVLHTVNNNKTEAAKILGISRTTLWRKIKRLEGISK